MKFKNLYLLLAFTLSLPAWALDSYTLDPNHTYVLWTTNHFGFSNPSGKWYADGNIQLDEANIANSKLDVNINLANLITGIKKFDDHIKSKDFLNVSKFPKATFVSEKIDGDKKNMKLTGNLNLHGVSKPVILDAVINKIDVNPINNKKTIGFSARTVIKRSDFGIDAYLPGVGDEVHLVIEGEANKNQ